MAILPCLNVSGPLCTWLSGGEEYRGFQKSQHSQKQIFPHLSTDVHKVKKSILSVKFSICQIAYTHCMYASV